METKCSDCFGTQQPACEIQPQDCIPLNEKTFLSTDQLHDGTLRTRRWMTCAMDPPPPPPPPLQPLDPCTCADTWHSDACGEDEKEMHGCASPCADQAAEFWCVVENAPCLGTHNVGDAQKIIIQEQDTEWHLRYAFRAFRREKLKTDGPWSYCDGGYHSLIV